MSATDDFEYTLTRKALRQIKDEARAEERERIALLVRSEVDGWDRHGGRYARQKHTMFNRLADRIATGSGS